MSRALFEDERISLEAKGMMGYILVKPDDWTVQPTDLQRRGGIGRDKTYRILNELIEAGYIERREERSEDGTFCDLVYYVNEEPCPENPDTDKPDTENKDYTKEECSLRKNGKGRKNKPTPSAPASLNSETPPSPDRDAGCFNQQTLIDDLPAKKETKGAGRRKSERDPVAAALSERNRALLREFEPKGRPVFKRVEAEINDLAGVLSPDEYEYVYRKMKEDEFWRGKHLSPVSVGKQAGAILAQRPSRDGAWVVSDEEPEWLQGR
jgi:hypothetical protein